MNQIETKNHTFFSEINQNINFVCDDFSNYIVVPILKKGYFASGEIVARIGGCFSKSLGAYLRKAYVDPISSKTILTLFKPIQNLSQKIAQRKPILFPFIHYLDRSFISSAQHLYIYIKEVNHLLEIPQNMKAFFRRFSFDFFLTHSSKRVGRIFVCLNSIRLTMNRVALFVLDYTIKIIDLIFQCILITPNFEVVGYLREILHDARINVRNKFQERAIKVIEKREATIRKTIVANVADYSLHQFASITNRLIVKTGLGAAFYSTVKEVLKNTDPITTVAIETLIGVSASYLLWQNCFKFYIEEYYHSYNEKFNPHQPHTQEFLNRFHLGYLYWPLEGISNYFKKQNQ